MLRRDPTRIELRTEDIAEFDTAKEEYLEAISSKTNSQRKKLKTTTVGPPPTPVDSASANQSTATNSNRNNVGSGTNTGKDSHLDPIEVAYLERKGKSAKDRIMGE
ncbi:hypothetical protein BGZ80_007925 [Entomortierella chlamydospora]|uniref:Anaphase-promoting complex subunit CDC26 n=1 Tax=Entomortierella chlamydospora TaxID=101097 RepID=A0A9P6T1B9_9FUNG|nr:hypothetical protein BGZ79_008647 [Entomortierella chlamydospora]KAG0017778.1 hypothetical protein BGZ80_007925 [Entomortierella chlamydospora]